MHYKRSTATMMARRGMFNVSDHTGYYFITVNSLKNPPNLTEYNSTRCFHEKMYKIRNEFKSVCGARELKYIFKEYIFLTIFASVRLCQLKR